MLGALVLALLVAEEPPAPPKVEPFRVAIFTSPLAPAADFALGVMNGLPPTVMAPLGVTFTLGDLDWSFDAAFVYAQSNVSSFFRASSFFRGGFFNLAVVVHTGEKPLNGFFIAPKVTVGVFQLSEHRMMTDTLLGFDFGWQMTRGRFYLAFILGLGIGISYGENDAIAGPWINVNGAISEGPDVVLGLNLHFLRLGFAL
jgi:hypothetical protein